MSITAVPTFEYPRPFNGINATPATVSVVGLTGAGYKYGVVLRAPKAGNIHKIGFCFGALATPQDTDFRVETVSAQFPSGTLWATNTNVVIPSGSLTAASLNMATLTADATVALNDLIGLVIAPAGTPAMNVVTMWSGYNMLPYAVFNNGAWAQSLSSPVIAIEYSDGSYALTPHVVPFNAVNTHTYNSGSTPDEIGAKFRIPVSMRAMGFWLGVDLDNTCDVVIYDSDGASVLATATLTNAGRSITTGSLPLFGYFASPATLQANTYYYLSVKPGASNVSLYSWDMLSAAALDQLPGGQDWHYVTAKDPSGVGSWSATTTRYPVLGLLMDGIDQGSGSGGGTTIFVIND